MNSLLQGCKINFNFTKGSLIHRSKLHVQKLNEKGHLPVSGLLN